MKTILQKNSWWQGAVTLVLALALVLSFGQLAYAADLPLVNDEAGLLSESEVAALQEKAEEYSEKWQMDIAIYTTNDLGGKAIRDAADDYFDYNGFGQGTDYSGAVFVLDMGGREYWLSTCGQAINYLTDYGIDYIGNAMVSDLSEGDYAAAFDIYLTEVDRFFAQADSGEAYDVTNTAEPLRERLGRAASIGAMIGLGAAIGFFLIFAFQLRSVARQKSASAYIGGNGFRVTKERDFYLYSNTTRRAKPKDNGGSSRGGSSTHRSSSGRSHGGGGGRF